MPPRKSRARASEEDTSEPTPVRRSARTRRSVIQDEFEEADTQPPKKKVRTARASASSRVDYREGEDSNESLKDLKNDEHDSTVSQEEDDVEKTKTPSKSGRGRARKVSEHKDTPFPKSQPGKARGRGRKRLETDETVDEAEEVEDAKLDSSSAGKKPKLASLDDRIESGDEQRVFRGYSDGKMAAPQDPQSLNIDVNLRPKNILGTPDDATEDNHSILFNYSSRKDLQSKESSMDLDSPGKTNRGASSVPNGLSKVKVKKPTGSYEENASAGSVRKDFTVASVVNTRDGDTGTETTQASLEKLGSPDIVAMQKSTPAAANVAETCGFRVVGNGPTRLLLKQNGLSSTAARIEVREPPETQSFILLARNELEEVTSKPAKKRVEEYLVTNCTPTDEFTVVTLIVDGKVVTLVNVQLESRNYAVTSLLIGCLMQKLESRPHAFILMGYMPHVRPGTPAYELLRDGYFGNHSIETLQKMRDIKLDDDDELSKGLIDFFWKTYQHSRPWMRSVYETVFNGESVVSATGQAVIWHSTKGVEALRVLNHAGIVKADLAIRADG